jgi:hypothetical protein
MYGAKMLDMALRSPLYQLLLVPQARRTMISTAEANGIDWSGARTWIADSQGPWPASPASAVDLQAAESPTSVVIPEYYRRPFHAYEQGNLCWEAAWEQELASKAVGARNFPAYRDKGEEAFRGAFDEALGSLGAEVPDGCTIIDLGCGTGISTRRLATQHPQAAKVCPCRAFFFKAAARSPRSIPPAPITPAFFLSKPGRPSRRGSHPTAGLHPLLLECRMIQCVPS